MGNVLTDKMVYLSLKPKINTLTAANNKFWLTLDQTGTYSCTIDADGNDTTVRLTGHSLSAGQRVYLSSASIVDGYYTFTSVTDDTAVIANTFASFSNEACTLTPTGIMEGRDGTNGITTHDSGALTTEIDTSTLEDYFGWTPATPLQDVLEGTLPEYGTSSFVHISAFIPDSSLSGALACIHVMGASDSATNTVALGNNAAGTGTISVRDAAGNNNIMSVTDVAVHRQKTILAVVRNVEAGTITGYKFVLGNSSPVYENEITDIDPTQAVNCNTADGTPSFRASGAYWAGLFGHSLPSGVPSNIKEIIYGIGLQMLYRVSTEPGS